MTGKNGFSARISEIRMASTGVKSFHLEALDGDELPAWAPGAHIDLALATDLNRQYSLCGDPHDRKGLRFAVLRETQSRGGSIMLHDTLKVGDLVKIVAVRNNFPLVSAEFSLLVAGGIGITPLLAMARELERRNKAWKLLYGGRDRASMAFLDELEMFGDKVLVRPQDEFGLLDLAGFLGASEAEKIVYCCGPEPLIKAVEAHCADWPEDRLQIERFRPMEDEPGVVNTAFEVELKQTGQVVTVGPEQSIGAALEDAGIYIPRSCNEGTCGTCLTRVIEGVPDHRDSFLRPRQRAKNNVIMVCCSRSCTPRLVLDV